MRGRLRDSQESIPLRDVQEELGGRRDMEQTKYYTSGEFARMARVSVRTIRFMTSRTYSGLRTSMITESVSIQIRILRGFSRSFCSNILDFHWTISGI